jgi:hypothetical protein
MHWLILVFIVIPCVLIVIGVIAETGGPRPNLPRAAPWTPSKNSWTYRAGVRFARWRRVNSQKRQS